MELSIPTKSGSGISISIKLKKVITVRNSVIFLKARLSTRYLLNFLDPLLSEKIESVKQMFFPLDRSLLPYRSRAYVAAGIKLRYSLAENGTPVAQQKLL
jgi:hypothetical protein